MTSTWAGRATSLTQPWAPDASGWCSLPPPASSGWTARSLDGTKQGKPADETSLTDISHLFGHYKRSKFLAEHEVLTAAAEGLDVRMVLPTFPLGPGDLRPTPTGKLVLDFVNGKMPGFVDTAMNVTHVDDLALGHLAALERGGRGRRYVLGGENMSMRAILQTLADCTGLPMPRLEFPRGLALAAGAASDLIEGRLLRREPSVPFEAARMSATMMIFSDKRARAEIDYTSRPAREAIEESARWSDPKVRDFEGRASEMLGSW